ncbi:MAG TPA: hypothetical protein VKF32_12685, partial [Thermoanaerobaculia bacterium]|nr:hypothetical protein [Thermoanaerobaculia bacterium]
MKEKRLALGALAVLAAAAAGATSTIPWTELTEGDAIAAAVVRRAVVAGRTVFYPTPPKERSAALEEMAARQDAISRSALRHLAEARRELGDLEGAEKALAAWAEKESASAWDEAARWAARYRRWRFAFEAAERALGSPGDGDARRALASDRIAWAEAHPDAADPLALTAARAALFPDDAAFAEEWVRALEAKGRLAEAESALKRAGALAPERRAIVAADLLADHGDRGGAARVLTAHAVSAEALPSPAFARELARRVEDAGHGAIDALRARLEVAYDRDALVLLELHLQGKARGDLAHELLTQIEVRYEGAFDRRAWLELARLWESIDGVPEAFRARLAAAKGATEKEERDDLAALSRLALRAGARALPWGTYNDEAYRWAARIDVTPGFFTGALSFLLTGFGRNAALAELEARRLPDRTFETARLLVAELARRAPSDGRLPSLRVALMERHVERGEGAEALALLPLTESGDTATRAAARRAALLAMRQTNAPLPDELRLWKERLALLAADGTRPEAGSQ